MIAERQRRYNIDASYIIPTLPMAQGAKKTARRENESERYRREVAERIYAAFKKFNSEAPRGQELTQTEFGRRVADRLKRQKPFPQGTVSAWMSVTDPSIPDNPTLAAVADVLNANFSWLAIGAATE